MKFLFLLLTMSIATSAFAYEPLRFYSQAKKYDGVSSYRVDGSTMPCTLAISASPAGVQYISVDSNISTDRGFVSNFVSDIPFPLAEKYQDVNSSDEVAPDNMKDVRTIGNRYVNSAKGRRIILTTIQVGARDPFSEKVSLITMTTHYTVYLDLKGNPTSVTAEKFGRKKLATNRILRSCENLRPR